MRKSLQLLSCLAILAAPLLAVSAQAQTASPPPPPAATNAPAPQGQWHEGHNQMVQLRAEREELMGERDRLKTQCMDAKGADRNDCQQKMKALHVKMHALHEKMEAMHQQHQAAAANHKGTWKAKHQPTGAAPSAAPAGNAPSEPAETAPAPTQE